MSCSVCINNQPPILFYNRGELYYEFTNFYEASVNYEDVDWRTAEHAFQAAKFKTDSQQFREIKLATTPREAFSTGTNRNHQNSVLRYGSWSAWDEKKDEVMKGIVRAKFTQNAYLRQMLLNTFPRELIENSGANDAYWGNGADGKGKNKLGKILMEVRDQLRQQLSTSMKYKQKYRYLA